jgi:hypothetical protein
VPECHCVRLVSLPAPQLRRYYAKGQNCSNQIRQILCCLPVGPCRCFEGSDADLASAFAGLPPAPGCPYELDTDYTCTLFPDDETTRDSFIVGLISLAVSLPTISIMGWCFALANDSGRPRAFLEWLDIKRKLLFGFKAHRKWHYTRGAQPHRYVKWWARCAEDEGPFPDVISDLLTAAWCALRCHKPPWVLEAEEAAADAAVAAEEEQEETVKASEVVAFTSHVLRSSVSCCSASHVEEDEDEEIQEAKELAQEKRAFVAKGIVAAIIIWGLMVWFIFTCACTHAACMPPARARSYSSVLTDSVSLGRRDADLPPSRPRGREKLYAQLGH